MLRIGIIGSDNSHADAFAQLLNLKGKGGDSWGAKVVAIYGHDPKRTEEVAVNGKIPTIVRKANDMQGLVDAVIVVFRHGGLHAKYALPFIKAGVPVWVDKPFATSLKEARQMISAAKKAKTLLTSFSTLRYAKPTADVQRKAAGAGELKGGICFGPADSKSEYGGLIFYGIHAVEIVLTVFGGGIKRVHAVKSDGNIVATADYGKGKLVALDFISNAHHTFGITVHAEKACVQSIIDTAGCYIEGMKVFLKMLRTGKAPLSARELLEPVAVMEAIQQSLKTGKSSAVSF